MDPEEGDRLIRALEHGQRVRRIGPLGAEERFDLRDVLTRYPSKSQEIVDGVTCHK